MRDQVVAEELVGEREVVGREEDGCFEAGARCIVSRGLWDPGVRCVQCGELLFLVGGGGSDGFDGCQYAETDIGQCAAEVPSFGDVFDDRGVFIPRL